MASCNTNDGGTEIPNEVVGKEYIAGQPVANADIKLIPVGYLPGSDSGRSVLTAKTDAQGRFSIRDAVPGQYNVIASKDGLHSYRDSVSVTAKGRQLDADTLKAPGSLVGRVALQPQHNNRTAMVQVLGTTVFVNVAENGEFILADLGAGRYRIRVSSIEDGYVPLFRECDIRAGQTDTLADTLRPFFAGIPIVTGLKAVAVPKGVINLRWNESGFGKVDAYLIYRDPAAALLPSTEPFAKTRDTLWSDTLYSLTPRPGQFPYLDSAAHRFRYRVAILDSSGGVGPYFGAAEATTIPPARQFAMGKWERTVAAAPFSKRYNSSLIVFKDKLWLYGGYNNAKEQKDLWSSPDGAAWTRVLDSLPIPATRMIAPFVFKDTLWIMGYRDSESSSTASLYKSADGVAWLPVADYVQPDPPYGFYAFQDKLVTLAGFGSYGPSRVITSLDGVTWDSREMPAEYFGTFVGLVAFADKLWHIGGFEPFASVASKDIWATSNGIDWVMEADSSELTPRFNHALAASGSRIWSIGGSRYENTDSSKIQVDALDETWFSEDGLNWELNDAHAPFGPRIRPAVAYFKGRIWVIGGMLPGDLSQPTLLNDVWSMETP